MAFTQAFFLIISVVVMYLLFFITGMIAFVIWGEVMEFKAFFLLNFGSLLFNLVISGIAYLATCLFNSSGMATSLGMGLPLAFFLLYVVSSFFGSNKLLGYCKYFTVNSLYCPSDILACNTNMVVQFLVMFAMSMVLFFTGAIVFQKKDLPL